jgi:predicted RNA-binding Zn-ribbon protein involved in translation (DUF1610 family)
MNFIPLRAYDSYIDANLRLQQLEAEGIRAYLQDEHTVTIDPILSNAVGGIKLLVYEEQAERAREIIETLEKEYRNSFVCPSCGSHKFHEVTDTKKAVNWLSAIITYLFGNYAVSVTKVFRCFDCGFETRESPPSS